MLDVSKCNMVWDMPFLDSKKHILLKCEYGYGHKLMVYYLGENTYKGYPYHNYKMLEYYEDCEEILIKKFYNMEDIIEYVMDAISSELEIGVTIYTKKELKDVLEREIKKIEKEEDFWEIEEI